MTGKRAPRQESQRTSLGRRDVLGHLDGSGYRPPVDGGGHTQGRKTLRSKERKQRTPQKSESGGSRAGGGGC